MIENEWYENDIKYIKCIYCLKKREHICCKLVRTDRVDMELLDVEDSPIADKKRKN